VTAAALTVRDLRAGYGEQDILKGISITVPEGRIVAIVGPNGSGKSTLLKAIYGIVPVRAGTVELQGTSLAGRRPDQITGLGLNMVPQIANVFPEMSVLENLELGALPIRRRYREQLAKVLAAQPLLERLLPQRAATLSGGQRQMVALGRALMSDPRLIILDEPSAGLAPMVQDQVFAKIKEINGQGVSVLMVEQRARQCLAIADYAYVLEQGLNRLEGEATALMHDPEVVRLYLGAARGTAA
jgi:ABC-type branched-subunit amino acid transport system ATPase component